MDSFICFTLTLNLGQDFAKIWGFFSFQLHHLGIPHHHPSQYKCCRVNPLNLVNCNRSFQKMHIIVSYISVVNCHNKVKQGKNKHTLIIKCLKYEMNKRFQQDINQIIVV